MSRVQWSPGGSGGGGSVWVSPGSSGGAGSTFYSVGAGANSASDDYRVWIAPCDCTLDRLYARSDDNIAAGESWTVTVREVGVGDTALTCTIDGGTNTANDLVNTVNASAGDQYVFKMVCSNNGGWVNEYVSACFRWVPT